MLARDYILAGSQAQPCYIDISQVTMFNPEEMSLVRNTVFHSTPSREQESAAISHKHVNVGPFRRLTRGVFRFLRSIVFHPQLLWQIGKQDQFLSLVVIFPGQFHSGIHFFFLPLEDWQPGFSENTVFAQSLKMSPPRTMKCFGRGIRWQLIGPQRPYFIYSLSMNHWGIQNGWIYVYLLEKKKGKNVIFCLCLYSDLSNSRIRPTVFLLLCALRM